MNDQDTNNPAATPKNSPKKARPKASRTPSSDQGRADGGRDKHPGGRPTDYSVEMVVKAQEYVDSCEDEEIQQIVGLSAKGTELYKNKLNVNIPTIEGLARFLRITKPTIYDWEKLYLEFSYVIGELRQKQAEALVNKGLSGDYNPTIAKVLLTKHGYIEKSETDVTTKGEKITTENQEKANEAIMRYLHDSGNTQD